MLLDRLPVAAYKECVPLGTLLRQKRREMKLSTKDVAHRLGVAQPTVSRWENGRCPEDRYLSAVAAFLDLPEGEIRTIVYGGTTDRLDALEAEVAEIRRLVEAMAAAPPRRTRPASS